MVSRLKQFCCNYARRLIAAAVLMTFIAALLPIPIPQIPENDGESSEPFPCQHHHCGCRTAEQCWKKCCCFTNAQKVAWAKSHHAQAPDFVIAAARTETASHSCSGGSCCRKATADAKVAASTQQLGTSASPRAGAGPAVQQEAQRPKRLGAAYVLGFRAQECQGQVWGWSVLPWSILPPPPQLLTTSQLPTSWPLPASDRKPESRREPPVPPPRVAQLSYFVA